MNIVQIYFNEIYNLFTDDSGQIIYDIYSYLTPNELILFREFRSDVILDKGGYILEIIFEDIDMEECQYPREPRYILVSKILEGE